MLNLDKNLSFINNQFRNTSFSKHFHNDYCFSLIYQGNLLFDNEKEKYNFTKGVLQVVNPYEFHTNKNSNWSSLNLMPTIDFINSIANDMTQNDIKRDITFNTFTIDRQAISLFNYLFLLMKNKEPNKIILDEAVIDFFEYMIKYHTLPFIENNQIESEMNSYFNNKLFAKSKHTSFISNRFFTEWRAGSFQFQMILARDDTLKIIDKENVLVEIDDSRYTYIEVKEKFNYMNDSNIEDILDKLLNVLEFSEDDFEQRFRSIAIPDYIFKSPNTLLSKVYGIV